jgi:hypothetical protein
MDEVTMHKLSIYEKTLARCQRYIEKSTEVRPYEEEIAKLLTFSKKHKVQRTM